MFLTNRIMTVVVKAKQSEKEKVDIERYISYNLRTVTLHVSQK